MMKVYIAAPYVRRTEAQSLRRLLLNAGIDVTSRWLVSDDELCHEHAQKDLDDVDTADALIAYNLEEWRSEGAGRHAEFGYAVAHGKRIIVLGSRTMIFHYLKYVTVVASIAELLGILSPVAAGMPTTQP